MIFLTKLLWIQPAPGQKTASGVGNVLAEELTRIRRCSVPTGSSFSCQTDEQAHCRRYSTADLTLNPPPVPGTTHALQRKQLLRQPPCQKWTPVRVGQMLLCPTPCSGPKSDRSEQPNPLTSAFLPFPHGTAEGVERWGFPLLKGQQHPRTDLINGSSRWTKRSKFRTSNFPLRNLLWNYALVLVKQVQEPSVPPQQQWEMTPQKEEGLSGQAACKLTENNGFVFPLNPKHQGLG